ncbi:hypothetical protein BUALT_Bualt09G0012400 [Buddleja alternifolia]|uniref:CRIB domain-containing protein n=1 Tax=Buddleja alternifolia TaxID=168488 RepID=A0AAV6X3I4_9LAMI|nr:hypothetical protein BUALT_Bualt09G0012400 [Buddleja alternifolia]
MIRMKLAVQWDGGFGPKRRRKCGKEELKKNEGLFKASLSHGFHTLLRRFKTFSQFFVYKQDIEHKEEEMEIGFPTDVKHVTHIGLEGSTTINPIPKWEKNLKAATEILSFPSISLQQFELAMAAQSNASNLA